MRKNRDMYVYPDLSSWVYVGILVVAIVVLSSTKSIIESFFFIGIGPIAAIITAVVYAFRVNRRYRAEKRIHETLTEIIERATDSLSRDRQSSVTASEHGIPNKKAWFDIVRGFLTLTVRPRLDGRSAAILDRNMEDYILLVEDRIGANAPDPAPAPSTTVSTVGDDSGAAHDAIRRARTAAQQDAS